jgi:hypothetical protein
MELRKQQRIRYIRALLVAGVAVLRRLPLEPSMRADRVRYTVYGLQKENGRVADDDIHYQTEYSTWTGLVPFLVFVFIILLIVVMIGYRYGANGQSEAVCII